MALLPSLLVVVCEICKIMKWKYEAHGQLIQNVIIDESFGLFNFQSEKNLHAPQKPPRKFSVFSLQMSLQREKMGVVMWKHLFSVTQRRKIKLLSRRGFVRFVTKGMTALMDFLFWLFVEQCYNENFWKKNSNGPEKSLN